MNEEPVRLAEIVAALSVATDLGMGQPIEFALRSCLLSLRLGEALRMSEAALREVYYQALLRYIGCNVETELLAAVSGDEIAFRHDYAEIDNGSTAEILQIFTRFIRLANQGQPPFDVLRALASGILSMPQIRSSFSGHCEVAQRLAARLGFDGSIVYSLGQLYERWDGKGVPNGLKGEAIAPAVRVVTLAQDVLLFHRLGGVEAAVAMARKRRGAAYSPEVVDVFCRNAESLLIGLGQEQAWETVLDLEPGDRRSLGPEAFDAACAALADFVDIKSTFTLGHSSAVADLAAAAARQMKLPAADLQTVKRAAWLHDLGRTGVSSAIWEKGSGLSTRDWEQIRLHSYYTTRILARPAGLSRLGELAGLHHERLDGSGYHRGLPGAMLPPLARLLAAADVFQALSSDRPQRPAFRPEQAAEELTVQARWGRLDPEAVQAVLAGAGLAKAQKPAASAGGLSERELEVLRLLARGLTTRGLAETLVISPKTADHHIQHIYTKIGVSTRAGATLFALEHHLL